VSKSPISMPDIADKSPVPTVAVARATDALVWSLVECLVKKGVITSDELLSNLDHILQETRFSGQIKSQEDIDHVSTSLALQRVIKAVENL
jgi:hypothetical protein